MLDRKYPVQMPLVDLGGGGGGPNIELLNLSGDTGQGPNCVE